MKHLLMEILRKAFYPKCLFLYISISLFVFPVTAHSQDTLAARKISFFEPSPYYNKSRAKFAGYTTLGIYAVTMTGLYQLWYSDYDLERFHFFNDNKEWMQMDKIGHTFSAYIAGKQGYNVCNWAGLSNKKSAWLGGNLGWVFLASVEVLDGFSSGWGFSTGDIIANTTGSASFIAQQLLWKEQRIEFKISYHSTSYAKYRPDLLGDGLQEELFKDYNGQTLWLSANIYSFLKSEGRLPRLQNFPRWLNVSIGYGAEGMIGATSNPSSYKGKTLPHFDRYRQFYLAPDIDLTRIKTKSKALKFIFEATRYIKFPLPCLEYNEKNKFVFHGLYF